MIKKYFTFLCLFLCFVSVGLAQKPGQISKEVKQLIQYRVDNGINAGIVVGVLDADGPQFYSYGVKSLETTEPVDEKTIFEIGSISKTFTGTILADKVLKGEVKLDDPLQKYLPNGIHVPTRNGESIKLVHLSNHTSALPRMPSNFNPGNPANPYADYSEDQLYDFLNGYELPRDIGSEYEYSNYAQGLLGHVLAAQSGMGYEELMIKVIAEPLGLKNTRILFTPEMKKNLAIGHSNGRQVENWDLNTLAGAGAIRSSATDMLNYLGANIGLVKSDLFLAMQLAQTNTRIEGALPRVGLGWHILNVNGVEMINHNGGTGGYRAFSGFNTDGTKAVVVLTNSDISVDDIGLHLLNPASPLQNIVPPIGLKIRQVIDAEGIEEGITQYWKLNNEYPDKYDFRENELNNLGYHYLQNEEKEKALAVFILNVEAFPDAFNVYDSLGEAYKEMGDKEKAIFNYKKSIEINPGNDNGIQMLKELGVSESELVKDVKVKNSILDTYVGKYELVPGFIITISREENQLNAQATGQPMFPIFAKSENVFYYKVVVAELTFNQDKDGNIESVTLRQGGQELIGKKQ